jgi:pimeloyl-ACP methyl ester carboxylesterase
VTAIDTAGLELISRRPAGALRSAPLLFVHGAFAGAWCWDEHFLPWFAKRGYEAHAVSLRGHGGSAGREGLDGFSIADYADDVAAVADRLARPPILVGHSMGGFVVQKYLERRKAAGTVLMASVPPRGLAGPGLSLAVWNPVAALSMGSVHALGQAWGSPEVMQAALFSSLLSAEEAMRCLARMGPESTRAMLDMYGGDLPDPRRAGRDPMLVMGAAEDALIPEAFVRATARSYGVEPHILDGIGHLMMLDAAWEATAGCLLDWLRQNGL